MSGHLYGAICPNCNKESLTISEDHKPFPNLSGECLECGFGFHTTAYIMDIAEINEMRIDRDMEQLSDDSKLGVINNRLISWM